MNRSKIDTSNKSACDYSLGVTNLIEEICKPLKTYMGIKCFGYLRVFSDCSYIQLISGLREFQKHRFQNLHSEGRVFLNFYRNTPEGGYHPFLWPHKLPKDDNTMKYIHSWDIWNGLSIMHRFDDSMEIFDFSYDRNSEDKTNFFTRNLECFIQFAKYFKYKASDIINPNETGKIAVFKDKYNFEYKPSGFVMQNKRSFMNELNFGKGKIQYNNNLINITKREAECINFLKDGLSYKSISRKLELSPRTVEHYIQNLKNKFEVNYKDQLIQLVNKLDIPS